MTNILSSAGSCDIQQIVNTIFHFSFKCLCFEYVCRSRFVPMKMAKMIKLSTASKCDRKHILFIRFIMVPNWKQNIECDPDDRYKSFYGEILTINIIISNKVK